MDGWQKCRLATPILGREKEIEGGGGIPLVRRTIEACHGDAFFMSNPVFPLPTHVMPCHTHAHNIYTYKRQTCVVPLRGRETSMLHRLASFSCTNLSFLTCHSLYAVPNPWYLHRKTETNTTSSIRHSAPAPSAQEDNGEYTGKHC